MEIKQKQQNDVTVIAFSGSMDATTSQQILDSVAQTITEGHVQLVFDLSDLSYLSSAGVRAVLSLRQDTRANGGDVRLACASGNIRRSLDIAGITKIMQSYSTVEESVASFSN